MTHQLMELPYSNLNALEPYISRETLQYHHGKHHQAYVNNLNKLIVGTEFEEMPLEEIITKAEGGIFNNAAQVFNHNYYFSGICSKHTFPNEALLSTIEQQFGSLENFQEEFLTACATLFGSGWVWLSVTPDNKLIIEKMSNADNPLLTGNKPLMTCDVWEHAYYIDYRNARPDYLNKWWEVINWEFVSSNFTA
ncbi:MAG TPA: superoxide dismutase [Campylobacterales bacterium]|nr:superoxide dismutase [Campylobacterales bacterium]